MKDKHRYIYLILLVAIAAAYLILTLISRPDKAVLKQYNLTTGSYYATIIPLLIVLVLVWIASFYGWWNIRSYSNAIRNSKDGRGFIKLANGLLVLSLGLPLAALIGTIVTRLIRHNPSWQIPLTIINNYANLIIMAIAFTLIAAGAERLYGMVRLRVQPWPQKVWVGAFILFSSLYSYFLVYQPLHSPRIYFLPNWLLLLTIAVPYMYFWYRGISASYGILQYQKHIRGSIYKNSLQMLAGGISVVIFSSIISRSITTVSERISQLSLKPVLFIIYGLILIEGIGFILIAAGARRLKRIEEA